MLHKLKIRSEHYEQILSGSKNFEVRYNDRDYQLHDVLHLNEYTGEYYTDRELRVIVDHIHLNIGMLPHYIILGFHGYIEVTS